MLGTFRMCGFLLWGLGVDGCTMRMTDIAAEPKGFHKHHAALPKLCNLLGRNTSEGEDFYW
jgi:hypothetical protein